MAATSRFEEHELSSNQLDSPGNRRSACDRCRNHKLRCERGSNTIQCRRCIKANSECVTGAALKSGRPIQMNQKLRDAETTSSEKSQSNLNHQQILPNFPTPPHTTFDTPLNDLHGVCDGDLEMLVIPDDMNGLDDIWNFEQQTSINNIPSPMTYPQNDLPHTQTDDSSQFLSNRLNQLGSLQSNILGDLEMVKACKTVDKCPEASKQSDSDEKHNFLIGRTLNHSKALIGILGSFEPFSLDSRSSDNCDYPTLISLLSCYVCLIRIYRTNLASILDSLPTLLTIKEPLPQLFPGMNLGGFELESRIDLQIQILVQVTEDMLSRMETYFGIGEEVAISTKCIFDPEKIQKLLEIMLKEEAGEQPPLYEKRTDCESLRNIIASLKHLSRIESTGHGC